MMEAKDLMIGDWVRIPHINKIGKVYRIDRANGKGNGFAAVIDGDFHESLLEPIPLTDEILKQNGFKYFHKNYASLGYEHPFQLKMNEWPDENGLGGLWTICDMIEIRYVHELQHALRLCRINMEIKIKED